MRPGRGNSDKTDASLVQVPLFPEASQAAEHFEVDARRRWLLRRIAVAGVERTSKVPLVEPFLDPADLGSSYDASWLRAPSLHQVAAGATKVRVVDVFSGCGGLSVGLSEACRAAGVVAEHALAIDLDPDALKVYQDNFPGASARLEDVEVMFDGELGDSLTARERQLRRSIGSVDFLVAGPPCQGHSDLNNHTRRHDPRNSLYFKMARCAEVLRPRHVVIENVPGVVHDKRQVVRKTTEALRLLGYSVDARVFKASELGVPQGRRRHVLVATKGTPPRLESVAAQYRTGPRSFRWACGDLESVDSNDVFDSAATHSETNKVRIDYLFDHGLYDLPDPQRPDCHRLKPHSYKAVYGRLRWDEPVPTITSGFGSTGQGRFVHPGRRRTITPHEAARVQFFPDSFRFGVEGRRALQAMIGNAVPSKLAYVVGVTLLSK